MPGVIDKQELQAYWTQLDLKTSTLLHLQEVLDQRGLVAARCVTEVLAHEKHPHAADVGKEWSLEEVRLLTLECIRPHLVDLIRLLLESLVAWHFIIVPMSDGLAQIVLAALFVLIGLLIIWIHCQCHRHALRPLHPRKPWRLFWRSR